MQDSCVKPIKIDRKRPDRSSVRAFLQGKRDFYSLRNCLSAFIQSIYGENRSKLDRIAFLDFSVKYNTDLIANCHFRRSIGRCYIRRNRKFLMKRNAAVKRIRASHLNGAVVQLQNRCIEICLSLFTPE